MRSDSVNCWTHLGIGYQRHTYDAYFLSVLATLTISIRLTIVHTQISSNFFCNLSVDVCIENESDSAVPATSKHQFSTCVKVRLKDETKSAKAAKLSTEFAVKVLLYANFVMFSSYYAFM